MRLPSAPSTSLVITVIASNYYRRPNNPGVSLMHQDDRNPQKNDKHTAPQSVRK